MNVKDLNAAVAAQPSTKLAIISQALFIDLLSAGELIPRIATVQVPRDPDYGDAVDDLIRSMGHDPDRPVPNIYHKLIHDDEAAPRRYQVVGIGE